MNVSVGLERCGHHMDGCTPIAIRARTGDHWPKRSLKLYDRARMRLTRATSDISLSFDIG